MKVKSIRLKNYRNYDNAEIKFAETFNIIYGNNAQGKTNIIEAIFLCASGRSHRTSKDSELLKYGREFFEVRLEYSRADRDEQIQIIYGNEKRKRICINEIPLKKIGGLMGHLNAVIFSPEDLLVIKQGLRKRRFMRHNAEPAEAFLFYDLQQYARNTFQRNNLLKAIPVNRDLTETLDVWDHHLVKTGSRIMKARKEFIKRLDVLAADRHERLTNCGENLKLVYDPSFSFGDADDEKEIEVAFRDIIRKNRERELQKGTTMTGPQRDDIDIILNGESTRVYASQGQQRTSVLSMKLAEIDLMKDETGEYPVLLLDDVLSELDDNRKEYLLESIEGIQTLITSTEKRFFTRSSDGSAFFHVVDGTIIVE